MDVVGGVHLADGVELKAVTGIDDNSRFVRVGAAGGAGHRAAGVPGIVGGAAAGTGSRPRSLTDIQAWWCPEGPRIVRPAV